MFKKRLVIILIITGLILVASPQLFHKNEVESTSYGKYHDGSIRNSYLLPFRGKNFKCYSFFSYYILGREFLHSKAYKTVLETFDDIYIKNPDRMFVYMESSRKNGGRLYPHRTHQSGLSIDFMTPLVQGTTPRYYNFLGIFRYLLNFDEHGNLKNNASVKIDFNLMAEQILLLDKHARANGLKIKKVIFRIELKDNLFQTKQGQKLKTSGIYFAQNLTPYLNKLHDDHFHVDFELNK